MKDKTLKTLVNALLENRITALDLSNHDINALQAIQILRALNRNTSLTQFKHESYQYRPAEAQVDPALTQLLHQMQNKVAYNFDMKNGGFLKRSLGTMQYRVRNIIKNISNILQYSKVEEWNPTVALLDSGSSPNLKWNNRNLGKTLGRVKKYLRAQILFFLALHIKHYLINTRQRDLNSYYPLVCASDPSSPVALLEISIQFILHLNIFSWIYNNCEKDIRKLYSGSTCLINAVLYDDYQHVSLLLETGADVNAKEFATGCTALIEACREHYLQESWANAKRHLLFEKIKLLLQHGADPTIRDIPFRPGAVGLTAIDYIDGNGHPKSTSDTDKKEMLKQYVQDVEAKQTTKLTLYKLFRERNANTVFSSAFTRKVNEYTHGTPFFRDRPGAHVP